MAMIDADVQPGRLGRDTQMRERTAHRRDLLLAPLVAALPLARVGKARAGALDPQQTMVTQADKIAWETRTNWPKDSVENATLTGGINRDGPYYILVRWHPGYMSAPHSYATDWLCVVVSGTWWVNSGADFDPAHCVPVPAGSFVRRIARTQHYDGVIRGAEEPVVIAICGVGPVDLRYVEPDKPGWRVV